MKRDISTLFSFSKKERNGIFALSGLLCLLLLLRSTMPFWAGKEKDKNEQVLLTAWAGMPHVAHEDAGMTSVSAPDAEVLPVTLFVFDPNTIDSAGLRKLGFKEKTAHLLLNWRAKGKRFYRKEDLRSLYTLSEEQYQQLEPYIQVPGNETPVYANNYHQFARTPEPAIVDLNHADSATFERLRGIGATLAHKIVERRKALGGYLRMSQLLEIYRFPDSTFRQLSEKMVIHPEDVRRLALNSCTLSELSRHPYIGDQMAKNILLYRQGLGHFENIEQLRQVPLMNEENYRKIAPYFMVE